MKRKSLIIGIFTGLFLLRPLDLFAVYFSVSFTHVNDSTPAQNVFVILNTPTQSIAVWTDTTGDADFGQLPAGSYSIDFYYRDVATHADVDLTNGGPMVTYNISVDPGTLADDEWNWEVFQGYVQASQALSPNNLYRCSGAGSCIQDNVNCTASNPTCTSDPSCSALNCGATTSYTCPGGTFCDGSAVAGIPNQVICGTTNTNWQCTPTGWTNVGTACTCPTTNYYRCGGAGTCVQNNANCSASDPGCTTDPTCSNLSCGSSGSTGSTPPPPPPPPVNYGVLDGANCSVIGGWAYEPKTPGAQGTVHIYDNSTFLMATKTTGSRPDTGLPGTPGFTITTPPGVQDGSLHMIHAYLLDAAGYHALQHNPIALICPAPSVMPPLPPSAAPNGYLDAANCTIIGGWAVDPNNVSASVTIELFDGANYLQTVQTTGVRPDLGLPGTHGYTIFTPASLKDGYQHFVYAYALNHAALSSLSNSPISVQCLPVIGLPNAATSNAQVGNPFSYQVQVTTAPGGQ